MPNVDHMLVALLKRHGRELEVWCLEQLWFLCHHKAQHGLGLVVLSHRRMGKTKVGGPAQHLECTAHHSCVRAWLCVCVR